MELARQTNCSTSTADGPASLMKCLREKSSSALLNASRRVETPEFLHAFGPSIDGVVIEDEYESNKKKLSHRLSRYDLLFGVTQADSFFALSADDNQYGMEADRRNRLLRTFVRNTYQFHLQEILATVVNEYTDWEKSVIHPINMRDETLEALSDAQYLGPLIKTADLHSNAQRSSYFYVFEYQTKASDFPQVSVYAVGALVFFCFYNSVLYTPSRNVNFYASTWTLQSCNHAIYTVRVAYTADGNQFSLTLTHRWHINSDTLLRASATYGIPGVWLWCNNAT